MTAFAAAAAAVLSGEHAYVVVTGRSWNAAEPLVAAAAAHVVAPGGATRLTVAAGVALGNHRAVTVVDELPRGRTDERTLAFTASVACAQTALASGWNVVQPWTTQDVQPLLELAARPALMVLSGHTPEQLPDAPLPAVTRAWQLGDLATIAASGPAVGAMVRLADRLTARGVEVTAIEISVLSNPGYAPLLGGRSLLVGGTPAAAFLRRGEWPDHGIVAVPLEDAEEADLVGTVLSHVKAAPAG